MSGDLFNIAHIETSSRIYGPGIRFVLWLHGCTLACEDCWNKEMWSNEPNILIHREEILARVFQTPDLTGITILGGEPLQQVENTLWLIKQLYSSKLDTMLYTGYELDEVYSMPEGLEILKYVDILIPGRFRKEMRNTGLRWRGSENQTIHFLTSRYNAGQFEEINEIEIEIDEWGRTTTLGYPS